MIALLLALALASAAPASPEPADADAIAEPDADAPVAVQTHIGPDPSSIGDLLELEIVAVFPRGHSVNLPVGVTFAPLHLVDVHEGEPEVTGDALRKRFRVRLQHVRALPASTQGFQKPMIMHVRPRRLSALVGAAVLLFAAPAFAQSGEPWSPDAYRGGGASASGPSAGYSSDRGYDTGASESYAPRQAYGGLTAAEERLVHEGYLSPPGRGREIIPVAGSLMPAVEQAIGAYITMQVRLRALRTVEAVRMHAAAGGGLPRSLEEVTAVPVPEHPMTGRPS